MAVTTPSTETPSVTTVSSPSARRLYYELESRGEASVTDLSEDLDYDVERVDSLLSVLESHGLVETADDIVRA
jgi:predicted transcriptional regulator